MGRHIWYVYRQVRGVVACEYLGSKGVASVQTLVKTLKNPARQSWQGFLFIARYKESCHCHNDRRILYNREGYARRMSLARKEYTHARGGSYALCDRYTKLWLFR